MSAVHESAFIAQGAMIVGNVTIGTSCGIWYNAVLRGDEDDITVGDGSNIQDGCVVHCDHGFPVIIGKGVTVGHNATIHGCVIEDGALVGMGATVMNGAKIGKHALVAAGALIPEGMTVPDGMLAMGCPAKIKRALTAEELAQQEQGAAFYIALAQKSKA